MSSSFDKAIQVACLLPKRNNIRFYQAAYQSLCYQKSPYEAILVCENHSIDGSLESTYQLAEESRITSVFTPKLPSQSAGESILKLIQRRPDADYYHIASSDDIWSHCFLAEMIDALQSGGPSVAAVFCDRVYIDHDGMIKGASGNISLPKTIPQAQALPYFLRGNAYNIAGALFRKDVIASAESFAAITGDAIDWALIIEAARLGDIAYVCKPLYSYRLHSANTARTSSYVPYDNIKKWLDTINLSSEFEQLHSVQKKENGKKASIKPKRPGWIPMAKFYAHHFRVFSAIRLIKGLE